MKSTCGGQYYEDFVLWEKRGGFYSFNMDGLEGSISPKADKVLVAGYCNNLGKNCDYVYITTKDFAELVELRRRHVLLRHKLETL